jgi:hypothetical protein
MNKSQEKDSKKKNDPAIMYTYARIHYEKIWCYG